MNKHEEKYKSDVKENEKSGEMRGFATPKQGMRGQKQGIWALPKRAHPLWMHFAKPDQIHNTKSGWKQKLLPFLNSYYYQNCCRADSFQHLYINNARKWYKVLIIRGMREKWIRKSASNPLFLFFGRHNGSIGRGQKTFLKMRISLNFFCVTIFFVYLCKIN